MIPRTRANLLIYHGAFAPRGCCREGMAISPLAGTRAGMLRQVVRGISNR